MQDNTEALRRELIAANEDMQLPEERWDTEGLTRDFEVLGFMARYFVTTETRPGSLARQGSHHYE